MREGGWGGLGKELYCLRSMGLSRLFRGRYPLVPLTYDSLGSLLGASHRLTYIVCSTLPKRRVFRVCRFRQPKVMMDH